MKQNVLPPEIMAPLDGPGGAVRIEPQDTLLWLIKAVFALIAAVILIAMLGWLAVVLKDPSHGAQAMDAAMKLIDAVASRILVPLFTLLLGYICGKRAKLLS